MLRCAKNNLLMNVRIPYERIVKLLKPAETEWEVKQGGFRLVDDTQIPDNIEDDEDYEDEFETDSSASNEDDYHEQLRREAQRGRSHR
jgi:hypothetical protein